jgi:hypothetical protein
MSRGSAFDEEPGTEAVIAAEDNDDAMGARETRRFLGGLYEAAEAAASPRPHWRMEDAPPAGDLRITEDGEGATMAPLAARLAPTAGTAGDHGLA